MKQGRGCASHLLSRGDLWSVVMMQTVIVLTRNHTLMQEIRSQLGSECKLLACDGIAQLETLKATERVTAVLVHFEEAILNHQSPGHFIAELHEATDAFPVYGLLDETCPVRLRKLAVKTIDECFEMPLPYDQLRALLAKSADLEGDLAGFWSDMPHKELHGMSRSLVTFTPEMFEMMDELKVAARHHVTVLLIGETGSGKTFLARLIHELSERRDDRFCTVACGALPPDLIESELFGYVKGAFTGADKEREGKFAAAGKGTLLLDEIDVLSPEHQAKLLRVIETGEYEQVGSNETKKSEARLIVASNYNLEDLVKSGAFRTDLYYRLNILNFRLLPLRERPWDVEYLARKFALEHSRAHDIPLRSIDAEFFDVLRRYPWPGNVREMENVIRRAVLYCQKGVLTTNDLPSSIRAAVAPNRITIPPNSTQNQPLQNLPQNYTGIQPGAPVLHPNVAFKGQVAPGMMSGYNAPPTYAVNNYNTAATNSSLYSGGNRLFGSPNYEMRGGEQGAVATTAPSDPNRTLEARVDVMEQRIIEDCLTRNNHRRKETAAELGISRVTLYNKMKKFGLL
jgi:transcriptional regulator with PAS, ATPase and Fis domain